LQDQEIKQAFNDVSQLIGGESGGKCLIVQISFQFFLNEVIESLDRTESGKLCQTLGATTPKALNNNQTTQYSMSEKSPNNRKTTN